jgi:hypothetical protein
MIHRLSSISKKEDKQYVGFLRIHFEQLVKFDLFDRTPTISILNMIHRLSSISKKEEKQYVGFLRVHFEQLVKFDLFDRTLHSTMTESICSIDTLSIHDDRTANNNQTTLTTK